MGNKLVKTTPPCHTTTLRTATIRFNAHIICEHLQLHSSSIKTLQHLIDLKKTYNRQIHYASYKAGTEEKEFEKLQMDQILVMYDIEPIQKSWASPMFLAPKITACPVSVFTITKQCSGETGLVLDTTHCGLYFLAWQQNNVFKFRRQWRILPSLQIVFHVPLPSLPISTHAMSVEKFAGKFQKAR